MKLSLGSAIIDYGDSGNALIELRRVPFVKKKELNGASDFDNVGRPISIEILSVVHQVGSRETDALLEALDTSQVVYSYDQENDALLINLNAIGEDVFTQRPITVLLLYDVADRIAAIEVLAR